MDIIWEYTIIIFTSYQHIQMKAYQITTSNKWDWKKEYIFKTYGNAVKWRKNKRAEDLQLGHSENKFWTYWNSTKFSRIKEIEVADDYWKKDFWTAITLWTAKWGWNPTEHKVDEESYLYGLLYWLKHSIMDLDRKNPDVKFMLEDINRCLNARFPKNQRAKQERDCFLSTWRTLIKLDRDDIIPEKDKAMYEEDLEKYSKEMEKLQADLVAEMNNLSD